jgi:hypothetical protein
MYSKTSFFCACGAIALLFGIGLYFVLPGSNNLAANGLVIEELERDIGSQQLDTVATDIHVRNESRQSLWIMGMDKG